MVSETGGPIARPGRWRSPWRGSERPLLFLDVDGTLLPLGGAQLPSAPQGWIDWQTPSNPQLPKIDRRHGPRLLDLHCDLVWATAWMHYANEVIAPLLGLPQLPAADLPEAPDEDQSAVLHWKTRALIEAAGGRPFAWVDDEITDLDRAWVSSHHPGHALLHRVDSLIGLTSADFAALDDWLQNLAAGSPEGAGL
ncbi:MAG TPA: HAD domain-containing protein [Streptosporangiaceae bacterium]|nr:HAD domain-containing protein [Streptosporangiaceae bacterium]